MSYHPVGYITDLIRELEHWKKNREKKSLPTETLDKTIAYLESYRELSGRMAGLEK